MGGKGNLFLAQTVNYSIGFDMSSDFYAKAQFLHEEFQKKELHYLNAERKLNDSLMWKRDLNVPLQEYLQKMHQREKKNEETYQSIMSQMSELDQRTDLLYSKIEKLGIFRNIQVETSLNDTNYPFTSRYIPQTLNAVQSFNKESELNSLKCFALKAASTQTESTIYCDNCGYEIKFSCQTSIQNSTSSTIDILSVCKDKSQIINSSRLQNDSFSNKDSKDPQFFSASLNTKHFPSQMSVIQNSTSSTINLPVSQDEPEIIDSSRLQNVSFSNKDDNFITSSLNTEHFSPQMNENRKHIEKKSENVLQTNENYEAKSSSASTPKKSKSTKEALQEKQSSLLSDEVLVAGNDVKNSESKKIFTESQSKLSDSEINVEVSVSKSDADSVNHEFDFLESDTAHLSSKLKTQNSSKNNTVPISDVDENRDQAANSDRRHSNKSSMKLTNERGPFQLNKEQETIDNRSETSQSGTRSPVVSLSDSDSVDEKGSFTASAAYQSLLGNTVIPSKINKQVSESESEDEVERTLASTVQKSTVKAKSSVPKKDKSVLQSVDPKPISNRPKPVSMNKPQSKLSKSTKKVLGIDTSSGSEIEAAVKPPENKKDEDSDEFDFYN